jgi:hypothetical protein
MSDIIRPFDHSRGSTYPMTTIPRISPTNKALETLVLTIDVYSFLYSFPSTTLVMVMRLFWYPSLMRAKPAQNYAHSLIHDSFYPGRYKISILTMVKMSDSLCFLEVTTGLAVDDSTSATVGEPPSCLSRTPSSPEVTICCPFSMV